MSRTDKIIAKWRTKPTTVEKEEVFCVLRRYGFDIELKRGSHTIISHAQLAGLPHYGLNGEFCLPVHNGRKIKGFHLKRVLDAVECVLIVMQDGRDNADGEESGFLSEYFLPD
ncbi:hypothetical protein U14_05407 [Candidatus Moduliflexus flocculans]|uniref:Type II toxin-antitoxin system HicA family toxin n=1 Tax=Candidatus Moduliflexus flocculans TaxID=1499966 RepID=A0A081BRU8_9BACT|nr:hypothetical protein U14_05407 [Candidatus Moduliflexus flocculans]